MAKQKKSRWFDKLNPSHDILRKSGSIFYELFKTFKRLAYTNLFFLIFINES